MQGSGSHHDFPILIRRIQVVADEDACASGVDRILDEAKLMTRIAIEPRQIFGDHQVNAASGDRLLGFADRRPIGPHAAGCSPRNLMSSGPW